MIDFLQPIVKKSRCSQEHAQVSFVDTSFHSSVMVEPYLLTIWSIWWCLLVRLLALIVPTMSRKLQNKFKIRGCLGVKSISVFEPKLHNFNRLWHDLSGCDKLRSNLWDVEVVNVGSWSLFHLSFFLTDQNQNQNKSNQNLVCWYLHIWTITWSDQNKVPASLCSNKKSNPVSSGFTKYVELLAQNAPAITIDSIKLYERAGLQISIQ